MRRVKSITMILRQNRHPDPVAASWRACSLSVYRFWRDLGYALGALSAGLIADAFGLAAAIVAVAGLTFFSGAVVAIAMAERRQP